MKTLVKKATVIFTASFIALGSGITLAGCNNQVHAAHRLLVSYTLRNGHHRIAAKRFHVKKGTTVLGGLKKAWHVEGSKSSYGYFVTSIHGYHQNKKRGLYWTYRVNGKYANKAANAWKLHNHDHVVWTRGK